MLPILVHLGPFPLYSFGLMVVFGFLAGISLAVRLARERDLPGDLLVDASVFILFAAVAGARLLFVALNWKEYSGNVLQIAQTWRGGMSFHGGAIAGVLAGVLYVRWKRTPALPLADAAAPGLALGYAIGRVGCLLNGCCYGGPTTLPWGMHFPGTDPSHLYHPAQIYATILNLALCAGLVRLYRRPHREGQVMAAYVIGYSVYRFLIEGLRRGVTADVLPLGLTEAQVFSLFCVVAGTVWWLRLQRSGRPVPAAAAPVGRRADAPA